LKLNLTEPVFPSKYHHFYVHCLFGQLRAQDGRFLSTDLPADLSGRSDATLLIVWRRNTFSRFPPQFTVRHQFEGVLSGNGQIFTREAVSVSTRSKNTDSVAMPFVDPAIFPFADAAG
jgi:hypothetical protein